MSVVNLLDIIWLQELNLVIIYSDQEVAEPFAAAAIIIKGEDGTDQFIPYEGFAERAPIAFSLGQTHQGGAGLVISVLGFAESGVPVELAVFQLDETMVPHHYRADDQEQALELHVVGFGERCWRLAGSEAGLDGAVWGAEDHTAFESADESGGEPQEVGAPLREQPRFQEQSEIGLCALDFEVDGPVDYSELLQAYLMDIRENKEERFTGFYITAVPRSGASVGPAVHLKPLNHYQFGFALRSLLMAVTEGERAERQGIYEDPQEPSPFEGAAIVSRYLDKGRDEKSGFSAVEIPEMTLFAGVSREGVDFSLSHGFKVHWRRQFENWSPQDPLSSASSAEWRDSVGAHTSFEMTPFSEREDLGHDDGAFYFRWLLEGAVIGDVVGVVFARDQAAVDLDIMLETGEACPPLKGEGLFIFMGDRFVPLDDGVRSHPDNLGLISRLNGHIERGLKRAAARYSAKNERVQLTEQLLARDADMQALLHPDVLEEIAESAPFGPELMVYRDHILQMAGDEQMRSWLGQLFGVGQQFGSALTSQRGRLVDTLRFEVFTKAPSLAHALIFNPVFREKFYAKPIDPHSSRKPVLEFVLSKLFSDRLIDWALRLKGESQAILWHLALKRPHMVEQLYDLKLEPDAALNPFDDKALDHAEVALSDSSQIDFEVLERKVIPILRTVDNRELIEVVENYALGLSYQGDRRKLDIGALSVCLAAVDTVAGVWNGWIEEAQSKFHPLIAPLTFSVPSFESGADFSAGSTLNEMRRDIGHLVRRLAQEKGLNAGLFDTISAFVEQIEADVFLKEIRRVLDLALKYHHDLSIGIKQVYDHFETNEAKIERVMAIKAEEWPSLDYFGPTFAEPLMRRQVTFQDDFDSQIYDFAQTVHPNDILFLNTLKNSLSGLEQALPKLVWLKAGEDLEGRIHAAQKLLRRKLLETGPGSAKLRRSKTLSKAIKQMIMAERLGPQGWPVLYKNLEVINHNLDASH